MRHNFTLSLAEEWNMLCRELVESPSLETMKTHLDVFLYHLLKVTLSCKED